MELDIANVEFYLKIYIELDFEDIEFYTELNFVKIKFQNMNILLNSFQIRGNTHFFPNKLIYIYISHQKKKKNTYIYIYIYIYLPPSKLKLRAPN